MSEKRSTETTEQPDLFGPQAPPSPLSAVELREVLRFGKSDAKCGLPLRNHYSDRISGERLAAYESAFRSERAQLRPRRK
jgi:hypothetical protein